MKKLLSILGSIGMLGTAGVTVVACGNSDNSTNPPTELDYKELDNTIAKAESRLASGEGEEINPLIAKPGADELATVLQEVKDQRETVETQEEVDGLTSKLVIAIEAFDKIELSAVIAIAQKLVDNSDKSTEVTEALKTAVGVAKKVAANKDATVEEINSAKVALETAIETFNYFDRTDLEKVIEKAEELIKDSKKSEAVIEALKEAIEAAKATLENEEATAEEINTAVKTLKNEVKKFEEAEEIDLTEYNEVIVEAKTILEKNKDLSSAWKLDMAIRSEKNRVRFATKQSDVEKAVENLTTAIENFKIDIAKEALKAIIAKANNALTNGQDKSEEAKGALKEAIDVAQAIVDKETTDQDEVDQAIATLEMAIATFNDGDKN